MNRRSGRAAPNAARLLLAGCVLSATGCARSAPSLLEPRGPAAREITGLWWPMLWVSIAVVVFVVAMEMFSLSPWRKRNADPRRRVGWGDRFVLIAGLGVTPVILLSFFVFSVRSMARLSNVRTKLVINVVAHDWWWEARYPNGAVTANEIHMPAGRRVRFLVRSNDVIHALWVPQLGPQIDVIPGRENATWLQADKPGRYLGICGEFCGLQHAHMHFIVIAEPVDQFERWMAASVTPARTPTSAEQSLGLSVFLSNSCIGCHAIRGTRADGKLGPDLTHFADRSTFAAGSFPVTAAQLRDWIVDPQTLKPGAEMPAVTLTPKELSALVSYLLSLGNGNA